MKQTKIKICEVVITSVTEATYKDKSFYTYVCDDGSVFNCVTLFNSGDVINVYIVKYKGSLSLTYSAKE